MDETESEFQINFKMMGGLDTFGEKQEGDCSSIVGSAASHPPTFLPGTEVE